MKTYEHAAQIATLHDIYHVAEQALEAYGLGGAELTLLNEIETTVFQVEVPIQAACVIHPYLGRIGGSRFVLKVQDAGQSWSSLYAEMTYLLLLCRDTELVVPEPVPTSDGSLVARVAARQGDEIRFCVLLRSV